MGILGMLGNRWHAATTYFKNGNPDDRSLKRANRTLKKNTAGYAIGKFVNLPTKIKFTFMY